MRHLKKALLPAVPLVAALSLFSSIAYAGKDKPCKEEARREKNKCPAKIDTTPINICDSLKSSLDSDFECLKLANSKDAGVFGPIGHINKNNLSSYLTEGGKSTVYNNSGKFSWNGTFNKEGLLNANVGLNLKKFSNFLPDLVLKGNKDSILKVSVSFTNAHFVKIQNLELALGEQLKYNNPGDQAYNKATLAIKEMCKKDHVASVTSLVANISVTISSDNKALLGVVAGVENLAGVTFTASKNKDGSLSLISDGEAVLAVKTTNSAELMGDLCNPPPPQITCSDFSGTWQRTEADKLKVTINQEKCVASITFDNGVKHTLDNVTVQGNKITGAMTRVDQANCKMTLNVDYTMQVGGKSFIANVTGDGCTKVNEQAHIYEKQ